MVGRKNRRTVLKQIDPAVDGPVRSCLGCGGRDAQERLIRFVRPSGGNPVGRNLPGRGFYLHRDRECLRALEKRAPRWFNASEIEAVVGALGREVGPAAETLEEAGAGVETLVRFALRTGRYVAGPTGARVAAHRRRAGVLLIANDMDPKRAEEVRRWAREISLPVRTPLSGAVMAGLTGRGTCQVLFIYDRGLAKSLVKRLGTEEKIG